MFKSLKNKLKSWIGKPKEETPEKEITKKKPGAKKPPIEKPIEKAAKEIQKGPVKEIQEEPIEKAAKEIQEEQVKKTTEKIQEEPIEKAAKEIQEKPIEKAAKEIQEGPSEKIPEKEKPTLFSKLTKKLKTQTLKKEDLDEIFDELELILLENNVALAVVDKIKENLTKDLVGIEIKKGSLQEIILDSLKNSISSVLLEPENLTEKIKKSLEPFTIVLFGINGSGKTTSLAKLAYALKKQGISCVLAAADTFRAASIEQLQKHADALDLKLIKHQYGADPAAVAFDAKKYAEKNKIQCVLIDTAGRMYTKENLLKEMEKIIRVAQPNLKIFVGESITGNDAVEQAKTFNEAIGIDGIILTKADVDEKGGTALSVSQVTGKPIYFLGIGQNYKDLKPFKKAEILDNLGLN